MKKLAVYLLLLAFTYQSCKKCANQPAGFKLANNSTYPIVSFVITTPGGAENYNNLAQHDTTKSMLMAATDLTITAYSGTASFGPITPKFADCTDYLIEVNGTNQLVISSKSRN